MFRINSPKIFYKFILDIFLLFKIISYYTYYIYIYPIIIIIDINRYINKIKNLLFYKLHYFINYEKFFIKISVN